MISDAILKEFGFLDSTRFPKGITSSHAIELSLPSVFWQNFAPVTVILERGLVIPVQMPFAPNGVIIRSDGTMVHVSHQDPQDLSKGLKVAFIDAIPFDIRIEVFNIMRRAVEINPNLKALWQEIKTKWIQRFPVISTEIRRQDGGQFKNIQDTWRSFNDLIKQVTVPFKVVVQTPEEFQQGWQGEEFQVDTAVIGESLRLILKNPVFYSQSTFRIFLESRIMLTLKLLVIAPAHAPLEGYLQGIEFKPTN